MPMLMPMLMPRFPNGLVLVNRNSAETTFTSSLLQNSVIGLLKIFPMVIRKLVWIPENCNVSELRQFQRGNRSNPQWLLSP